MSIDCVKLADANLFNPEAPDLGQVLYFGHDETVIEHFGCSMLTPPRSFLVGSHKERDARYYSWVEGALRSSARSRRERAEDALDYISAYVGYRKLTIVYDSELAPEVQALVRHANEFAELYYSC